MKLYFDLETSTLPLEQLLPIMPEFDPPGNIKDPDKIKAAIEAKKQDWIDAAALRATTGQIIAASYAVDRNEPQFVYSDQERNILGWMSDEIHQAIDQGGMIYAWNIFGFDLPFLSQRCAIHGISTFPKFTSNYRGRWSWKENFVDPMQVWCGPYQRSDGASLKAVGHALGVGEKTGNGKDFAELLKTDPEAAKQYAIKDVLILKGIVEKMGI